MNRWLSIILLIIISCTKPTTDDSLKQKADNNFPFGKESFDWTRINENVDKNEKIKFGEARPWLTAMYPDIYLNYVHSIDINNDGEMDIIYSGPGPVTEMTIISLGNKKDDFVFEGQIVDMEIHDRKVIKLYITSLKGSGAPVVYGQTIFKISYSDSIPAFEKVFDNETLGGTSMPTEKVSYEIQLISDTLIARESPIALDTPYNDVLGIEGNKLGLLTKGTRARVVGEQKDTLNNDWLCVLIYPKYRILGYPYTI